MIKIETLLKSLPPLPCTVQKFEQAYKQENHTISDFVKIIIEDPMLTANLLKLANSSIYGFTQRIKSLDQAIALFGVKAVRSLVINFEIQKLFIKQPLIYGMDIATLTQLNIKQAKIAASWASEIDKELTDDIFMVALLSDMGKLLISKALEEHDHASMLMQKAPTILHIKRIEKKLTHYTSEAISAKMYENWNLDTTLINTLNCLFKKGHYPRKIKKMAVMVWVVKTALNCKENLTDESIQNAQKIAHRYKLEGFSNHLY